MQLSFSYRGSYLKGLLQVDEIDQVIYEQFRSWCAFDICGGGSIETFKPRSIEPRLSTSRCTAFPFEHLEAEVNHSC